MRFTGRCGCPGITITVNDSCTGAHISGASVTIGATTKTTNASGQVVFCTSKGASVTITKSGYCDGSTTIPTNCANVTVSLKKNTAVYTFKPTLCCGQAPNATYPITVSVSQTSGGSFTGSCTDNSASGCNITMPVPCSGSYTFDVTYSATHFQSVTNGLTINAGACATTVTGPLLTTPSGDMCDTIDGCFSTPPATLSAHFTHGATVLCDCTFTFSSLNSSRTEATYTAPASCCSVASSWTLVIKYCLPTASTLSGAAWQYYTGTLGCPTAFGMRYPDGFGGYNTVTFTE